MAPTVSAAMINTEGHISLTNKLRKPVVEKIRRERINSSIEKLKSLLSEEFLKQQPDSRQEKAEILEMTLDFLRRQQQKSNNLSTCSSTASEGYSRCVQESVNFLSQCQVQTQSHRRLLKLFLNMQPSTEKNTRVSSQLNSQACQTNSTEKTPACCQLWRPW
ncbi:transcription factor HES-5-like [Triplophysa dalaica]|uniref:transcription factor HES-5-like n=1 Tax=Triplophysa dalaica TaxID=1582913 RepID=UPI0024DF38F0|nr:transcription factor HES-5-like [Triplophysa dalaica]